MGSAAFWTGEFAMMVGLVVATIAMAGIYAALENVFPFLRGGLGRM
ncbi:MAG: hypothetical protein JWN93_2875 [Hyphomicrobiales bacterium]|nr:hypothetical protein [Hyphomicrobiales bacterium]